MTWNPWVPRAAITEATERVAAVRHTLEDLRRTIDQHNRHRNQLEQIIRTLAPHADDGWQHLTHEEAAEVAEICGGAS